MIINVSCVKIGGKENDRQVGKMKKIQNIIGTLAMLLLIFILLITSFKIAIYGDPDYKFYEKEYEKYNVTESLNMKMEDVMEVTDKMMAYLIGDYPELSVTTMVDGKEQDFFNEQDRLHMWDVKNLFLGGLKLRAIAMAVFVIMIVILVFMKADLTTVLPKSYYRALSISAVFVGVLAAFVMTNFNKIFVIFHKVFFTNDLWIFDPRTDYMIRMLPEGFFYDMVIRIGGFFILGLITLGVFSWVMQRVLSNSNKQV